jgi:hypothetical protein
LRPEEKEEQRKMRGGEIRGFLLNQTLFLLHQTWSFQNQTWFSLHQAVSSKSNMGFTMTIDVNLIIMLHYQTRMAKMHLSNISVKKMKTSHNIKQIVYMLQFTLQRESEENTTKRNMNV